MKNSHASKEVSWSEMREVNNLHRQKRTGKEMRLSAQIGEHDMDQVILDQGSAPNVLTKKKWEFMGKPKLKWSPIQLIMENQQKIVPLGRLSGITTDIEGVHTTIDFEVIEIVDDNNPYPTLLGQGWEFSNMAIINLKKRKIIFERNIMRVIVPLDPLEGARYTEPVKEEYNEADIDNIYQIKAKE